MGLIISASEDFNYGKFTINDADVTRQSLKEYVKQNELRFIYQLLGVELGNLLIADLGPDKKPQTQKFIDIFNPLTVEFGNTLLFSKGIREILKGLVYSEFVREQNYKNNINGSGSGLYPQGDVISANNAGIVHKYNDSINSFCAVQMYITENKTTYPEFKGTVKEYASLI